MLDLPGPTTVDIPAVPEALLAVATLVSGGLRVTVLVTSCTLPLL
jgi:hypothetical protein